jgi:hypothetical protein
MFGYTAISNKTSLDFIHAQNKISLSICSACSTIPPPKKMGGGGEGNLRQGKPKLKKELLF